MCLKGGGGGGGPQMQLYRTSSGEITTGEAGIPQEYVDKGATTTAGYQLMAQQDLSDRQLAAQREIATQQQQFNQTQFDYQKELDTRQKAESDAQAQRQTTYDAGRSTALNEGSSAIENAFARFSPDYFRQYTSDYMAKAKDEIDYQKAQANRDIQFDTARRGVLHSQDYANKYGLLAEKEGRAIADQTNAAEDAANTLRGSITGAKAGLLGQVQASQSIGSPIAGPDLGSVNTALQTQRQAISGIQNQAGDVVASVNPVPTVSSLGSIFGGLVNTAASGFSGYQANRALSAYETGLRGGSPFASRA